MEPSNASQARHSDRALEPLRVLKVPAGQARQARVESEAPVVGLYVPGGQGVARPSTQVWPVGQGTPRALVLGGRHSTPLPHRPVHVGEERPAVEP